MVFGGNDILPTQTTEIAFATKKTKPKSDKVLQQTNKQNKQTTIFSAKNKYVSISGPNFTKSEEKVSQNRTKYCNKQTTTTNDHFFCQK